jgi:hypothetical protein
MAGQVVPILVYAQNAQEKADKRAKLVDIIRIKE